MKTARNSLTTAGSTACTFATVFLTLLCLRASAAQFEDVTVKAGVTNAPGYCIAAGWGDYDNDQDIDLYLAIGFTTPATNAFFRNNGNGTFTRVGSAAGPIATDVHPSAGCAWVDFNNDGYRDLLVLNLSTTGTRNDLYWNNGDGTFRSGNAGNLTQRSQFRSWSAAADYDGDGWVDIYVTEANSYPSAPCSRRLYHASPDGTFSSTNLGPTVAYANDAVWGDYDNDGDPDLFICGYTSGSALWRNDGHGNFTPVANGLPSGAQTVHAAWADYDRDGDLDIALSSFSGTQIYRNDGTNFAIAATLAAVAGGAWADYDNDGYLDLLVVGGQDTPRKPGLFHNDGNGSFSRVSDIFTEVVDNWLACPWGDYDNDGFMDVVITHQYGQHRLYRNLGNTNHWIKFKLVGTASNRDGIGAKVRVQATINGQSVWQMQEVNGGYCMQNDTRLNFGLGDATNVDLVRIEWPSGNVQELTSQSVDRIVPVPVTEQVLIYPVRPTASLGGSVTLTSQRAGTRQWYHEGVALEGQTNQTLNLSNIQVADCGRYSVVTSLAGTSYTNFVYLFVDTQFTKINEGPLVTDVGTCGFESTAGDYSGDGYEDIFVTRWNRGLTSLYQNNQDGTFSRVSTPPSQSTVDNWGPCAWGDFDNDGGLDLMAVCLGKASLLYWNNRNGTFSSSPFDTLSPWNVAVADYDRDGRLDLYFSYISTPNRLYHNLGSRTFRRMLNSEVGPVASDATFGGAAWADYDDDGWPDLCAPHLQGSRVYMYHNQGNGRFVAANNAATQASGPALSCAWGDCDNDGRLDLFVVRVNGTSRLYRNLGNGVFEAGTLSLTGKYNGASWADYDSDGFLDLFVSAYGGSANVLYHNNGDGSFTRVTTGSVVTDLPLGSPTTGSYWGTWFDYDNNGFPDLYVVNGDDNSSIDTRNFLYRNNGNSNAWLKVKPIGTTSNRDAVGAKVRVLANYAGQSRWQRRDITGGDAINGAQSYAHFGLGNATAVNTLKIEWPSGVVEQFANVAPRQTLTIVEPSLNGHLGADGAFHVAMTMSTHRLYQLQTSTNLVNWATITNCTGSGSCEPIEYVDPEAPATYGARFYRIK